VCLLTFWRVIFPWVFICLMLLFLDLFICSHLIGGFSHLKSFPWINFYVLAGLVIVLVVVSFLFNDLKYNLAITIH
jgi:hypothetical protein